MSQPLPLSARRGRRSRRNARVAWASTSAQWKSAALVCVGCSPGPQADGQLGGVGRFSLPSQHTDAWLH
eukprot:12935958-Prorocentrum_lima.AAC.1